MRVMQPVAVCLGVKLVPINIVGNTILKIRKDLKDVMICDYVLLKVEPIIFLGLLNDEH